ncbi:MULTISPECIES: hypothetical protein [Desulfobacula]|uniref:Uncharacterized protein n=2 Tax=Desulfobacula TaxID=28222 RepID=K0NC92_DESTT|nr:MULTISPECIES: hypothetical protein [Desulfobacula]CCK78260.1 uncharacterized protein TOL2_C00900 [Desulfobacula toluolica Tol2]SDU57165.1 hypothetical protein SAMN04487931_11372 [Desulfobacula phenolica]
MDKHISIKQISTKQALKIWAEYSPVHQDHISQEKLYLFSLPGGLQKADNYDIHHLSLCPRCLSAWETLCSLSELSLADDPDEKQGEEILSYGLLQAASSAFTEPVYINSSCDKFRLGIFPDNDNPQKAMIVLETTSAGKSCQGMTASIRDANGFMVMEATVKQGRAASITDHLDTLDLSTWTIILSGSADKDTHE